jgi:Na+/H+ antiporter NhaA
MYACIREFEAKRPLFFIATVLVLVYANSPWAATYADVWQTKLTVGLGGVEEAVTLRA